jgi:hypothetical protein
MRRSSGRLSKRVRASAHTHLLTADVRRAALAARRPSREVLGQQHFPQRPASPWRTLTPTRHLARLDEPEGEREKLV